MNQNDLQQYFDFMTSQQETCLKRQELLGLSFEEYTYEDNQAHYYLLRKNKQILEYKVTCKTTGAYLFQHPVHIQPTSLTLEEPVQHAETNVSKKEEEEAPSHSLLANTYHYFMDGVSRFFPFAQKKSS